MQDHRSKILEDNFEDAALQLMLHQYAGESGAQLRQGYEHAACEDAVAESLDRTAARTIQRAFRKRRWKRIGLRGAAAVILIVACLGLSLTTVMSVDALKVPFLNFLLEYYPGYLQVGDQTSAPREEENIFSYLYKNRTGFVPEGYTLVHADYSDASFFAGYTDTDGNTIAVSAYDGEGTLRLDVQEDSQDQIVINGMQAIHWANQDDTEQNVLILDPMRGMSYLITAGSMDEDPFLDFVFSFAALL